jgi:hypothetical protein
MPGILRALEKTEDQIIESHSSRYEIKGLRVVNIYIWNKPAVIFFKKKR